MIVLTERVLPVLNARSGSKTPVGIDGVGPAVQCVQAREPRPFLLLGEVENAIQDLGNGRIHFPETFGHRTLQRCGQFDELTDQKFIAKGFLELFLA